MTTDFVDTLVKFTKFFFKLLFTLVLCWIEFLCDFIRFPQKSLSSDIVLVTGAATGLGRQLCIEFAPLCGEIVAWDINTAELDVTAELVLKKTGKTLRTYKCDLRDADVISCVANRVLKEVGVVTILVNNAGVYIPKMLLETTQQDVENIFSVNVLSHYHTARAFVPSMISRGGPTGAKGAPRGHIVTVASIAGIVPAVGMSLYCASKAAALLASESLRLELCSLGFEKDIHVTRVLPFHMDTTMFPGIQFEYPWLTPSVYHIDCAREIVTAVRSNREVIYVYGRYRILCILKLLLPWPVLRMAFEFTGADKMAHQVQNYLQRQSDGTSADAVSSRAT